MKPQCDSICAQRAYDLALDYEIHYGCCPQCVLSAVDETLGGIGPAVIKAGHGLSGGGGLTGVGTCGALSGGLMALSTKRGRTREQFARGKFISNFRLGQELVQWFAAQFGGITCQDLQQRFTGKTYDLWDQTQYAEFSRARGDQCARATAMTAKWVVERLGH